jgi:hypothetical protein
MGARLELVDECRSLVRIRATTNPWMKPPQNAVAGRVVGRETHASSRLPEAATAEVQLLRWQVRSLQSSRSPV